MRFLAVLILIVLLAWIVFREPEPDPEPEKELIPLEDSFISGPLTPYNKAQKFQQEDYNQALDEHRRRLDEQEGG